eukprot:11235003-Karenia_brevis.AAC.1
MEEMKRKMEKYQKQSKMRKGKVRGVRVKSQKEVRKESCMLKLGVKCPGVSRSVEMILIGIGPHQGAQ